MNSSNTITKLKHAKKIRRESYSLQRKDYTLSKFIWRRDYVVMTHDRQLYGLFEQELKLGEECLFLPEIIEQNSGEVAKSDIF
jgi:hypothetical protein